MKVYFSFSKKNILEYEDFYRTTRQTILDIKHTLTRDWLDKVVELVKAGKKTTNSKTYKEAVNSAIEADVCIFDISNESLSLGARISDALHNRKPTLLIGYDKVVDLDKIFITKNESPLLTTKTYSNKKDIPKIVKDFLNTHVVKPKNRFNLLLDKKYMDYLAWASYKSNLNKTDIIKRALDKEIKESDGYQY